jgi:hypothetical protein
MVWIFTMLRFEHQDALDAALKQVAKPKKAGEYEPKMQEHVDAYYKRLGTMMQCQPYHNPPPAERKAPEHYRA